MLGLIVVVSWVVALCASALAHRLLGRLFTSLSNMSLAIDKVLALDALFPDIADEVVKSVNSHKTIKEAKLKLANEEAGFNRRLQEFEKEYFPAQDRVARLSTLATVSFVFGFVTLGIGYGVWAFST
jgi:hypothetical protein